MKPASYNALAPALVALAVAVPVIPLVILLGGGMSDTLTRIQTEPFPVGGRRVKAQRTTMTAAAMLQLVIRVYRVEFGAQLTREQAAVLVAQWGVETAWGRATFNWNVGNVKAGKSYTGPYVALLTWEYHRREGRLVKERWIAPFRAYSTADAGVSEWMRVLFSSRHGRSRAYMLARDPAGFGRSLANRADGGTGYATARADKYALAINNAYSQALRA